MTLGRLVKELDRYKWKNAEASLVSTLNGYAQTRNMIVHRLCNRRSNLESIKKEALRAINQGEKVLTSIIELAEKIHGEPGGNQTT